MKIKMQAVVVYEWEEDSANWDDKPINTEQDLRDAAIEYAKDDPAYILDCEPLSISVGDVKIYPR